MKKKDYEFVPVFEKKNSETKDLNFEYVKQKEQLILPIYFPNFMDILSEEEIKNFNLYILNKYISEKELVDVFEQLINVDKIPHEILSKYWARAYTLDSNFYRNMNRDLKKLNTKNYLTYIQIMYEAIKIKSFPINNSKYLYRGTYFTPEEMKILQSFLSQKKEGLPGALVYCRGFYSFSKNEYISLSFSEPKPNFESVLLIIENNDDSSLFHSSSAYIQNFSKFEVDEEILFFPFSCFEVKSIFKSKNNIYIIKFRKIRKSI